MFNFPRSWHTFSPVILHSLHLLCTNHLNLLNTCSLSPLVSPYAVLSACKVSSLLHALSLCSVSYMACSSLSHILHVTLAVIIVGNLFYLPIRMQTSKKLETDYFTAIPRTGWTQGRHWNMSLLHSTVTFDKLLVGYELHVSGFFTMFPAQ